MVAEPRIPTRLNTPLALPFFSVIPKRTMNMRFGDMTLLFAKKHLSSQYLGPPYENVLECVAEVHM